MPNPPQVTKVGKHLSSPSLYSQGASYFLDSGKQLQTREAGKGRRKEGREGRKKEKVGRRHGRIEGKRRKKETGEKEGIWGEKQ